MKKKIILAVLMATLLTGCGKTIPTLQDGKEAVVKFGDGSMISIEELYDKMKNSATNVLMQMVDKKILEEEYEDKLDEAKEYAENYVSTMKKYLGTDDKGVYSEAQFLTQLQSQTGYTSVEEFQEDMRVNYLQKFAIEDYIKGQLKDKEIEKYYKDEIVGDRDVYHIQVKSTMTDTEKEEANKKALEKAKELIARLKKGESFEDVAKDASDDEATKEKGGSLGFINKGKYGSAEFDKEVYALKVGEFSNTPVKTTNGYEIVYVKEEKEKKSMEDVKDEIVDALIDQKLEEDATLSVTAIKELRKSKGVEIIDSEIERNFERYMERVEANLKKQNESSN